MRPKLGQRTRSISPSIKAADDNANKEGDSTREPKAAFVNECAAQQQDATDSRIMTSGHVLPHIMDAYNVKSPEGGYDEYAADALPQNMEASNVAREAPVLDSAAVNGVNALEASLALESAGVFTMSCTHVDAFWALVPIGISDTRPTRAHCWPSSHA
jgi:hypothetical protein